MLSGSVKKGVSWEPLFPSVHTFSMESFQKAKHKSICVQETEEERETEAETKRDTERFTERRRGREGEGVALSAMRGAFSPLGEWMMGSVSWHPVL